MAFLRSFCVVCSIVLYKLWHGYLLFYLCSIKIVIEGILCWMVHKLIRMLLQVNVYETGRLETKIMFLVSPKCWDHNTEEY